ncbi:hypothetical protein FRC18_002480 [Serendipita sp. 400]|nr:hypothetical protein FRC18_002480 [Serendipita sp. 400]
MHSSTLVHILCIFILGSSTTVSAAPMNTGGGGNTPVASGSRTPRTPTTAPMPGGEFPPIDKKAIKDVCTKVENKIMKMSSSFEENHGRMPDERTLTETIAYKLGKNAGKISFHTQAQEGVSGADLLLQMTLDDGFADDLSHKLGDLSVTPKEQKGATTRAKSKATSGTASASASSGATATGKKLIVILQAKSYHKNADKEKEDTEAYKKKTRKPSKGEPERVAGFTYQ